MPLEFRSLPGVTPYREAHALMLELVEQRAADQVPDTVLLLEHRAVVTRGKGLQQGGVNSELRHMPFASGLPADVEYAEIERGGDLTLHNPGQLVIYPIIKLDGQGWGPARDVLAYLRKLEKVVGGVARAITGQEPSYKPDATGVWVGERKIASIGIAVRKWVTYHGAALNCVNDLAQFSLISPCGYAPEVMCSLERLKPGALSREAWRAGIERHVREEFAQSP